MHHFISEIWPLTWLRCLELQPMRKGRRSHLVDTGHPNTVVGVTVYTRENLQMRRNQNLLLRKLHPPGRTHQQLMRQGGRDTFNTRWLILCVGLGMWERERETWMLQVDSSEYPLNSGFHDNVTLSTMLRTWSCTGAAGKTEIDQQSVINHMANVTVWSMLTLSCKQC